VALASPAMGILAVPFFIGEPMPGFAVPHPHRVVSPELPDGSPQERMAVLYAALADAVATDPLPAVYAGDCLAAIGVVAGLQRAGIDPTLVWFDAHGDFHTWDTTGSGFLGGMPLAMLVGRGETTVMDGAGARPLTEDRAWLVGARDLDRGEDEAVAGSAMTVVTVEEAADLDPPPGPIHVHLDVDVVDPVEMPAVNYPAPGGPGIEATLRALRRLAASGRVAAFSVSSWNPALPGADRAAEATRRLADPFLSGG
jgi:arginase